jgi:plasmid replication initiation protein
MLPSNKDYYVQSNQFIQAKYKEALTFTESLIIAKMCNMIEFNDEEFKDYRIYINELLTDVNRADVGGGTYKQIYEAAEKLRNREVQIKSKDEQNRPTRLTTTIVTSTEELIEEKDRKGQGAYISLTFHPKLKPYLLQLKQDFTRIDFGIYQKIHASHAIRLYHIFSSYLGRGQHTVLLDVDELKEMLGVAGKYGHFPMFKKKVLDESQVKINSDTDLSFEYKVKKNGHKILGIEFTLTQSKNVKAKNTSVKEKPNQKTKQETTDEKATNNDELSKIITIDFGVNKKIYQSILNEYTEQDIRQAIAITQIEITKGKIQNIAGFFVEALKNKYQSPETLAKQKNTEKKTKLETEAQKDQAQKGRVVEEKRKEAERKIGIIKKLITDDDPIIQQAITAIKNSMFSTSYNDENSLIENLENPMFIGSLMNFLVKIDASIFDV